MFSRSSKIFIKMNKECPLLCYTDARISVGFFFFFFLIIYFLLAVLHLHCCACFSSCGYQGLLVTGSRHTGFSSYGIWTRLVYDMWNLPGPGIEPVPFTGRHFICYTTREVPKVSFFLNFCFNQAEHCLKRFTNR